MSRFIVVLLLCSLLAVPAAADISVYGYLGVADETNNFIGEIQNAGIPTNVASVIFPPVWTSLDFASVVESYRGAGVRTVPWLDHVLFRRFPVSNSTCVDDDGPFQIQLRANWQARLANFVAQNGGYISSRTTATLVIFSEINNACVPLADVETAAQAVKSYFPGIPTSFGYGFDKDVGKPAPAYIPPSIDWVGFYDYGYFDPQDPTHCNNGGNQYQVYLLDLLGKLLPYQRALLVPDGFWWNDLHGTIPICNGNLGWPRWYLQFTALNYEQLALAHPQVIGIMYWLWASPNHPAYSGTRDLPASVRNRHREIGCRNLGGC